MKKFEIKVSPIAEEFCLAFSEKWVKLFGHLIIVNGFQFSAIFEVNAFLISEVQSGAKCFKIPVPSVIETYEDTLFYLEMVVGPRIADSIEYINQNDANRLSKEIERLSNEVHDRLGAKPAAQQVDAWLKDDVNALLN